MNAGTVRRIWLCADDYGLSPGISCAIRDLIGRGRINASSAMVVAPSFSQAEAQALSKVAAGERPAAIGLHLTLTAPFQPLVSTLQPQRGGRFLPLLAAVSAAFLGRYAESELAAEIDAQFETFAAAFGRPPDFVDGHLHVHLLPQVRDAVLAAMRAHAPGAWVRQCGNRNGSRGRARLNDAKGLLIDRLSREFRRRAAARGIVTNPTFAGTYRFRPGADFTALFPIFLRSAADQGVIMCHPGFVDAELERLDPLTTLREREYAYFAGETFPQVLADAGVVLAQAGERSQLPAA